MIYIIWANIYLVFFYGFYWFFMRKETFFQLNRWYLLSSLLFAFSLPALDLKEYFWAPEVELFSAALNIEGQVNALVGSVEKNSVTWLDALWALPTFIWIYLLGCLFFFSKLLYQGILIKKNLKSAKAGQAYSFFHIIKVDPDVENYAKVLEHERVHVKHFHSVDILAMELVKIFIWFNPIVYMMCKSVKLNHEYIADAHTAEEGLTRIHYAESLLNQAFESSSYSLRNNFINEPFIKNRVMMLFKNKSRKSVLGRFLVLIPILLILIAFQSKAPAIIEVIPADLTVLPAIRNPSSEESVLLDAQTGSKTKPVERWNAFLQGTARHYRYPKEAIAAKVKTNLRENAPATPSVNPTSEGNIDAKSRLPKEHSTLTVNSEAKGTTSADADVLFLAVEKHPEPPGGMSSFLKYIGLNYPYPEEAIAAKVGGRIITTFVVEADGSLSGVKVIRDLGYGTGDEAIRVIENGEKWSPGMQNGQAVRVQYTLPIVLNFSAK